MAYNTGYYMGFPTTKLKAMPYKITQSTTKYCPSLVPRFLDLCNVEKIGEPGDEATTVQLTRKDKLSIPEIYPSITWMHGHFC